MAAAPLPYSIAPAPRRRSLSIGRNLAIPNTLKPPVRDLWEHASVGSHKGGYSAKVPSHGVVVLTVMPE